MKVFSAEECPQRSEQWFRLHMGIPTGSELHKVMAKMGPRGGTTGKEYVERVTYLRLLAGEIITGEPREKEWSGNRHTERGKDREVEAASLYGLDHDCEPTPVGFVMNGNFGVSPDFMVGPNPLEIKDILPHRQIARLQGGNGLPGEHKWQVYGELLACEDAEYADFMSHCRGLPSFYVRTHREQVKAELAELRAGIDQFCAERDRLVELVKAMA